ncbi:hypothetical protein [Caldiplasma sukawensis]
MISQAFSGGVVNMHGYASDEQYNIHGIYKTDISVIDEESALTNLAGSYDLKQNISFSKSIEIHGMHVSLKFKKYNDISTNEYAIGIIVTANDQIHSAIYALIKEKGFITDVKIFPIVSTYLKSTYSFTLKSINGRQKYKTSLERDMGISRGWLSISIPFNQQQMIELTALLSAGVAISGFVAAIVGVTVLGDLEADAIALILALGASYIKFMNAEGDFQGINLDFSYLGWSMVNAPEYNIPRWF